MKVLLVCDLEDWVLGEIARQLACRLCSDSLDVRVLVSQSSDFGSILKTMQREYSLVHFLSPWDFFDWADRVCIPCVVTLWHMVDWGAFEPYADRVDTLCVGSQQWLQRVINHIPNQLPVRRMHYGLDTDRFTRNDFAREKYLAQTGLSNDVLILGFAGSGSSNEGNRKGLDRLWSCLLQLRHELHVPFVLRIIGRHWSPEMVPLELRSVTHLELDLPSELLPEYYSSLDYYVCTSRQEGVPYPVLEAMSCQCVVISTPVGVVPEILKDGTNGFLLREGNLQADFVEAVRQTMADREFREARGRAARETMTRNFSWHTSVSPLGYEETYWTAIQFYRARPMLQHARFDLTSRLLPSDPSANLFRSISLRKKVRLVLRRLVMTFRAMWPA
jgi:glycosyltransferase involved in cell wall biosynthesis